MDDIRIRPTTVKELVSNLRDLGLHVTDTDFIKPSNARTIVIFKYLLAMFVPWRAIAFEQLSFDAAQRLFLVIGTSPVSTSKTKKDNNNKKANILNRALVVSMNQLYLNYFGIFLQVFSLETFKYTTC